MKRGTTTTSRVNQQTAAALIGVTVKALTTWERTANWWPKNARTHEGYDVQLILANRPKTAHSSTTDEHPLKPKAREAEYTKTIEDAIRAQTRRKKEQLELRKAEGELIPRHGIEQSYADLLTGIADWAEQLPDVFITLIEVPKKYHKHIRNKLREQIEKRQHELRDDLEAKAIKRDSATAHHE